jgi:FKBP-type peptidyl-prolyl cis-trans isomerase
MQKLVLLLSILFVGYSAQSQIRLASGLEYRLVKKGKGTKTAKPGDYISVVLKGVSSGATIFDTKTMNKPGQNLPVNFKVQKKQFNGDVIEVLALLHEGDSAVITIPQDSFYRMPVAQRPKNYQ